MHGSPSQERKPDVREWRCTLCGMQWKVENRIGRIAGMASILTYHVADTHPERFGNSESVFQEIPHWID